jgi:serine/threonine protein kinase
MVMEYIEGGNLRELLKKDYKNLNFESKLLRLINISQGLKDIHAKNLVHRDFHSGNILSNNQKCFITDLGLSKLSKEANDGKIMGVLPYVAPEVLRSKVYSKASDVYSFGIIAWEILSGLPPYHDTPHDEFLAIKICQGLRPNMNKVIVPQLLKDLIERCWGVDPTGRSTASELVRISREWQIEIANKSGEFYQQYLETEKLNQTEKDKKICELLSELYHRYKGKTIKVKTEEIQKVKDELYLEFCRKHSYEKNSKGAKEKFEELFSKINSLNYTIHPSAVYTSKLLNFKNLPEPQNSKRVNDEFYSGTTLVGSNFSQSLQINFQDRDLEETRAQTQILPK